VVRSHANLLKQKEVFTQEKSSVHTGLVWYTNMVAISLFWNTNMAAVTSPENALYPGARFSYNLQQDSNRRRILTFLRSQENVFSSMTDRILRKVIASITRSI